jgi:twitching motility protein PilT
MAKLDDLFKIMISKNASDLHLTAGTAPWLRVHGEMEQLDFKALSNEECQALIFEILTEKQKRNFLEFWELDCSYTVEGVGRFRCNIFMQRKGMGAVFRVIPEKIKSVDELGLPRELLDMINVPKGLICVTGSTGSGKSTTLAALIAHINATQNAHILTIEDPIEFVHPNIKSLVNQREVNSHTKSFANALKASLREDPDIILVGEMRDLETIQLALTAAETGHLVFGTLHTSTAHKTIDRIIDVFPEGKQAQIRVMLAESLRGVIAQTLLPRADNNGRVAVLEVLFNTKSIANLIREGKTFQIPSAMQTGKRDGMITYEGYVESLVVRGLVRKETAQEFSGTASSKTDASPSHSVGSHPTGVQPAGYPSPTTKATPGPADINATSLFSLNTMVGIPGMPGMPVAPTGPPGSLQIGKPGKKLG